MMSPVLSPEMGAADHIDDDSLDELGGSASDIAERESLMDSPVYDSLVGHPPGSYHSQKMDFTLPEVGSQRVALYIRWSSRH